MKLLKSFTKSLITPLFILQLMTALAFQAPAFGQTYKRLVIFGDSLSDTGNIASVTTNFPFPFFDNRISDGPVLVDYLAAELGLVAAASRHTISSNGGDNFAVSGGNIVGNDTEDLSSQVSAYLARETALALASSDTLYFIMMGGNDLRDIRSIQSESDANPRIDAVALALESQLSRLYQAGARNFLVANVADIGAIPESIARRVNDPPISQRARAYVERYNSRLNQVLQRLSQQQGSNIAAFDVFSEFDKLINNATSFGFTKTEVGCFTLDRFRFESDCVFGTRFDRFVFFDNIHPSGRTNQLISGALIATIPPLITDVSQSKDFNMTPILQLLLD